jgi:hypothetical protein
MTSREHDLRVHRDGMPRAWLLNLDAELELRRPQRYQPTAASLRACAHFAAYASQLIAPNDVLVSRDAPVKGVAKGYLGVAWCPTPSALAALENAGATLAPVPALACLQQVNHRRFHADLGQQLPGARFARDAAQARELLQQPSPNGWMVKRGFGFAGRSNRRFPTPPTPDDWRWLDHAFHDGGVQVEPYQVILAEYSIHGHVEQNGRVTFGVPCTRLGTTEPLYARASEADLTNVERAALFEQGGLVSGALASAGYWGPFGIDAFRYQTPEGPCFNPRSEINARHTLAYAIGMGGAAPETAAD